MHKTYIYIVRFSSYEKLGYVKLRVLDWRNIISLDT